VSPDDILRGGQIGRWRIVRLIATGGFSWVFEVEDPNSRKRLALKVLKPEAAKGEEYRRFWREAKILAALDDPHLVAIVMLDRDEPLGVDYYVMELLTGCPLAQLLKESEPSADRVIEIFLGALRGLARLHAVRPPVIHRDIKPANIQITADGRAKVLDLGIAGTQRDPGNQTVSGADDTYTTTATFKGTPKYASPEQLQILPLDTSSDVFSMGLCLFEALEGRHPYSDQPDLPTVSYQSVLGFYARLEARSKELSLNFRRTPKPIQSVVRRALSLRPQDRYRNAAEMGRALAAAAQGGADPSPPDDPDGPSQSWVRLAAGATGLALVLVAGIGVYLWVQENRDTVPRPPEPTEQPTPSRAIEPAPVAGPSAEQERLRSEAAEVAAEVERLRTEGSADTDDATNVIERKQEGDHLWAQERFQEAQTAYGKVVNLGNQVIELAIGEDLARKKAAAEQAREQALPSLPELNAATEWGAAEELLHQAQRAESERRKADAAKEYTSAREAYAVAGAQAEKTLAAAQAGEKAALNARARLTGKGDCAAIGEPPEAKKACGAGVGALADGSVALDARNAPSALKSFEVAKRSFEEAKRLIESASPPIASNRPPTLSLSPAGALSLERGKTQTIHANPRDPEGKGVEVTFTIREPGGTRRTSSGAALRFQPELNGEYRIEAVGTDVEGARSQAATLVVSVIEPKASGGGTLGGGDSDVTAEVRKTLEEYADAISSYDLDALRTIAPSVAGFLAPSMTKCTTEHAGSLAASVTPLETPEFPTSDRARQRFSQRIDCVTRDGTLSEINKEVLVATLSRRADGWYIDEIRPAEKKPKPRRTPLAPPRRPRH
jgi:serine/threonine-protein kinase